MSKHTKKFLENIISKNFLEARKNLKDAIDATIERKVEDAKEDVRLAFSDN